MVSVSNATLARVPPVLTQTHGTRFPTEYARWQGTCRGTACRALPVCFDNAIKGEALRLADFQDLVCTQTFDLRFSTSQFRFPERIVIEDIDDKRHVAVV
jgi:hypothetical protein